MIKKYLTYINEAAKPKFFDVMDVIDKFPGSISIAEKELENLTLGEICVWYTKGNATLKKQVVSEVRVTRSSFGGVNIYFNGFSVDPEFSVEIEQTPPKNTIDVVGFPSGEVLTMTKEEGKMLYDFGWIKYEDSMFWRDIEYKNIYFFSDKNYHKIKGMLDPKYKKPEKTNIKEKQEYEIGDVIVGKGFTESGVNIDSRIGKIIDKDKKEYRYLIQFMMHFSTHLMKGNTLWVSENNIKGIYTGDISTQLALAKLQRDKDDLEEHEIDDEYHINQLFKKGATSVKIDRGDGENLVYGYAPIKSDEIQVGDRVILKDKKDALYQFDEKGFVSVWFEKGRDLGKVEDIKYIDGEKCVRIHVTSAAPTWYKMSCVEKK